MHVKNERELQTFKNSPVFWPNPYIGVCVCVSEHKWITTD